MLQKTNLAKSISTLNAAAVVGGDAVGEASDRACTLHHASTFVVYSIDLYRPHATLPPAQETLESRISVPTRHTHHWV